MEMVLTTQQTEIEPEPGKEFIFTSGGLLNSNYKTVAQHTYSDTTAKSVFGMRQRLKFSRFNTIMPIDVVLKLSVFAFVLAMLF